jgi:signal transduction histidine kinase
MAPDRPRRGTTVRFRITAVAALAVAVVLAATGAALVIAQRRVLTGNLDEALASQADAITTAVAAGPVPATLVPGIDDDGIGQVVDAADRVVAATPGDERTRPIAAPPDGTIDRRTIDDVPGDVGVRYRVFSRRAEGADGPVVVHTAAPLDDIEESTALLARSLAVAVPVATALLAVVVWWLVGRTLRPVEAIRREVAGIGAGGAGLDRRVPVPAGDDEVTRLARTMNGMLDRIEDAARRQQRFVADASHELRSPLARVRAEVEVDLAHPAGADPDATAASVLAEVVAMQHLVDDLLALARADAGVDVDAGERAPVDLDDLVDRHARRLRAGGRVAVDSRGVGAAQVVGDRDQLARAIGNVVDNAARHARTTVTLAVREDGGTAVVSVADDGPGIPPDRRDEVFERFSRLDDARSAPAGGTGLGLAIAREIVVVHGGTIAVDPAHTPGARLVITLPRVLSGEAVARATASPDRTRDAVTPRPEADRQPASPPTS